MDIHGILSDDRCSATTDNAHRPSPGNGGCNRGCHETYNPSMVQMACPEKAKECLGPLLGKGSEFKQEFNKMVHHVVSEKEFEDGWECMVERHGLQKNTFLTQIYETRRKWAKPYFMDVFCAKMTSTQRSESANHLLKGYVPPGSPKHLFVRQYEKMQFDRDSEESYQEKRTKLGGVILAQNLPIEIHASQIYTRAMFEKFGEMLYEGGSYVLTEVVARREYIAVHVKKVSRDKWSKNEFLVRVNEPADEFNCECGMFEHFGMVCSHALKVMIHLGLQEVPAKHVLKRWTKDARDILPPEFLRYQKDQGPVKYSSGDITICISFALKLLGWATAMWMLVLLPWNI
ncbi:Protein FAR1-RELATED SEQUENCE 5 [Hordeum vulgare]|nr:Protein FAR1-RELATED SEQUENCE 5 [Hordeum vulgare]